MCDCETLSEVCRTRSTPPALALKHMHPYGTFMHMRTTLIIDDELLAKAQQLTGLREKTAVLHAGLQALIARENARRLAALGGSERSLKPIPRRRSRAA
jgi:Arc/MetJ family transcription regulator